MYKFTKYQIKYIKISFVNKSSVTLALCMLNAHDVELCINKFYLIGVDNPAMINLNNKLRLLNGYIMI